MVGRSPADRHGPLRWTLVLVVVYLLIPTPARGQYVDLRIFGGPSITSMNGDYVESATETWGFTGGAALAWHISRRFMLEGAFATIQKGGWTVVAAGETEPFDYRFGYTEIPILLTVLFPLSGDDWVFGVFGGGAPSFGGACSVKPVTQHAFKDCTADTPGGELESFDAVVMFGVKMDRVFTGGSGFGFDAKFSQGTQNVLTGAADQGLTAKNFGFDVKLRIWLPLGGPRQVESP